MSFEITKCVVLNSTYEPLSIVPSKRALILVLEGKAVAIEEHPYLVVRSPSTTVKVPVVVLLKEFIKHNKSFKAKAQLSQRNLFIRDNYTCQYCDRNKQQLRKSEFLTRDHILPRFKGGLSNWENLVTACSTCNHKKRNRTPTEANMQLKNKPFVPTMFELWVKNNKSKFLKDYYN